MKARIPSLTCGKSKSIRWVSFSYSSCSLKVLEKARSCAFTTAFRPAVGPSANLPARVKAVGSKSSSPTQSQISPQAFASEADKLSPNSARPLARARPTRFGRNQEAHMSGMIPRLGPKTSLNFAVSAATAMSPARARPTPPPAATPLMAVTTGFVD